METIPAVQNRSKRHVTATTYDSASIVEPESMQEWLVVITASPEAALLARILQKASTPETLVQRVVYDAGDAVMPAVAQLRLRARPTRVRAVVRQLEKLVMVRDVILSSLA